MADLRKRVARAIWGREEDWSVQREVAFDTADAAIAECRVDALVEALEECLASLEHAKEGWPLTGPDDESMALARAALANLKTETEGATP